MELYEFIFLVLGIISLIDYILCSIVMYKYRDLGDLVGYKTEFTVKRKIEIVIIIITIAIFVYKFIF